ncbi:MAG: hypothetical protein IBX60_04215 [Candidatus Aminicenantes bacterium]|nr:hypothetical protein [Candidatus Aminicenantes bacterium]
MEKNELKVSAPGRICLLGEHQDYFGLSIIAAAINLRIFIQGKKRSDRSFKIQLPDIGSQEEFSLEKELAYTDKRDYLKSTVNVLQRNGFYFPNGWDCTIHGTIPINSGTASSSAMVVAWVKFLLETIRHKQAKQPERLAEFAFLSEVAEFNEPGGKMDHYSSAFGGVIAIHFNEKMTYKKLKNPLKEFVLADSLQRKDTTGMLGYIKNHVLKGVSSVKKQIKDFDFYYPLTQNVQDEIDRLEPTVRRLLKGTLLTRDLTMEGEKIFEKIPFDHDKFGRLLSQQHEILRDYIQTSTKKIDSMIEVSLKAGALGAKINGSGGGGCIFAYAPGKAEEVADALEKLGTKPLIIRIDDGARKNSD